MKRINNLDHIISEELSKEDPGAKKEEWIFMEERIISKRQKNIEKDKAEEAEKTARKLDRLNEENEIIITILSEIKDTPQEKIIYNYSKDISMAGTKIQGNFPLPNGTKLKIDLTLKNAKQKVTVFGRVIWTRVLVEDQSYEAGVEFVDTPNESIKKLGDYVESVQEYANLNPVGVPYWIFAKFNKPKA